MTRDIVVTGAACVTCLGLDRASTWSAVREGRCGIGPLTALESCASPLPDGGQAPDPPPGPAPAATREVRYLRRAIGDAWREAFGVSGPTPPPDRCGLVFGTTLHGMRSGGAHLRSGDPEVLASFLAGAVLRRAVAGLPAAGFAASPCSACASGLTAVADACHLLAVGQADVAIAGGYDPISEYAYGGFSALRLVSSAPTAPFARDREGLKIAEGYGVLVLEREQDARRRGARTLARILGLGGSSDLHHLSEPHPEGEGAARAMRAALHDAGCDPGDMAFVAAHATGTPGNDAAEYRALRSVFGEALPRIPVTAFKSHLGHALGGAGAVELVLALTALHEQVVPPVAHLTRDRLEFPDLDVVTATPRAIRSDKAICSSFGFGGSNACVVIGTPDAPGTVPAAACAPETPRPPREPVWITGLGVVAPGGVGNDAFVRRLADTASTRIVRDDPIIPGTALTDLIRSRRVRRMSDYVKLTLAASTLACRNAGIEPRSKATDRGCAVLGTSQGSAAYAHDCYVQIVAEGPAGANPMLFAEGVPNAASAHLGMMLGLKGPCQTLIGSRTAGLDALSLAVARLAGDPDGVVFVGAAEEYTPVTNRPYAAWGLYASPSAAPPFADARGFATGAAAVTLVLERAASAQRRGARCLGIVESSASIGFDVPLNASSIRRAVGVLDRIGLPAHLLASANATWIDRFEGAVVRAAYRRARRDPPVLAAWYGRLPESFSAGPLVGLAAVLLEGSLPVLPAGSALPAGLVAPRGDERPESFGVLATDYAGQFSAVRVGRGAPSSG